MIPQANAAVSSLAVAADNISRPDVMPATVAQESKRTTETCEPPTIPLVEQPRLDEKEVRAYEVARQRAKHPADRRKARNQKKAKAKDQGWLAGVGVTRARGAQPVLVVGNATFADLKEDAETMSGFETVMKQKQKQQQRKAEKAEIVVQLEDLTRVAKVRKARAGDFEFIPSVPSVIALDDADFTDPTKTATKITDFEVDDWEHVESCSSGSSSSSSDETEPSATPSYAQVVSSMKQ